MRVTVIPLFLKSTSVRSRPTHSETRIPAVSYTHLDAIKKIADEGPCILVGRCADYALEEYDNVLSVFLHAAIDSRIRRIARIYDPVSYTHLDVYKRQDNNWTAVILLDDAAAQEMADMKSVKIRFSKDNETAVAGFHL